MTELPLQHKVPGGILDSLALLGVHLSEIERDTEEEVSSKNVPVGIHDVLVGCGTLEIPAGLIQEVDSLQ